MSISSELHEFAQQLWPEASRIKLHALADDVAGMEQPFTDQYDRAQKVAIESDAWWLPAVIEHVLSGEPM